VKFAALAVTALALAASAAQAADPPADACLMLNNRVLGPRTENRPLPLLKGDAEHGFTPACAVAWSVLSPKNDALPVESCFHGSLLQLPNDSACGAGTGKLWIGMRWVVTSADLAKGTERAAVCQQLETGAWAGTRAFSFECKPRSREFDTGASDDNPTSTATPVPVAAAAPTKAPADGPKPPAPSPPPEPR
jgi:hypothetical protein